MPTNLLSEVHSCGRSSYFPACVFPSALVCVWFSWLYNFLSPTWGSLSFPFPFLVLLCIPSVSCYSGWLCFRPMAYQGDLRFISVCICVFMGTHFLCVCVCVCVKRHQSVILRKLLCLYSRHRRSTFHLPDEAACLTSRFYLLHHLHIISIHFSACDCLLSRHVSPTPWLLCLRSLCKSICLAADVFSLSFSLSFLPKRINSLYTAHIGRLVQKRDETLGNNPLLPRTQGDIREKLIKRNTVNIFHIWAIA